MYKDGAENKTYTKSTPQLLDCYEYMDFWVSWDLGGTIRVGKGRILNQGQFFNWTDSSPWFIHMVGLTTQDSISGNFIASEDSGMECIQ